MVYGSKDMFSSGNDLSIFVSGQLGDDFEAAAERGVTQGVYNFVASVLTSKKPTVFVVRGMAVGISFTIASNADFIYCTPSAKF